MSYQKSHPSMPSSPKTIGSVAHPKTLEHTFSPSESDIVELRLDSLLNHLPAVKKLLIKLKDSQIQTLITARCTSEGGQSQLNITQRSQLLMGLSPLANFVDIEIANLHQMKEAATHVQNMGCLLIASHHDFKQTPPAQELKDIISKAVDSGAEIAKLALYHNSTSDMFRCAEIIQENSSIAISIMGMGPLAPSSRLLYAQLGSILNYGYIGNKPTAPGQWKAELLNQAIQNSPQF